MKNNKLIFLTSLVLGCCFVQSSFAEAVLSKEQMVDKTLTCIESNLGVQEQIDWNQVCVFEQSDIGDEADFAGENFDEALDNQEQLLVKK